MIAHMIPVRKRTQSELVQSPTRFPVASMKIGMERKMSIFAFGMVGLEKPFTSGKIKVPSRNPA
jgi:hypothetical protein